MNELFTLPTWDIAMRTAQGMNIIFCVMVFSGAMPMFYLVGVLYCVLAYWTDRLYLLRYARRPPLYNEEIMSDSCRDLLPVAVVLHLLLSMWTYGNQSILPSGWSDFPLTEFWQGLLGVSDEGYAEVMAQYLPGVRVGITTDYFFSR